MHKPWHSLIFGISLFGMLAVLSQVFPEKGIALPAGCSLSFPSLSSLFAVQSPSNTVAEALEAFNKIDTSFALYNDIEQPVKKKVKKDSVKLITSIQFRNKNALKTFFDAIDDLATNPTAFHVLHYGDSQIEGDRISDYLRMKLQEQFGGGGPGLISLMPLTQSIINKVSNGYGWDRYNVFIAKDKRVKHNNYGVLAGFCRFCGYRKVTDTSVVFSTVLGITTTPNGGERAMAFDKLRLFYGGSQTKTWCEFYEGPALMSADSLLKGGIFNVKEYRVTPGSDVQSFKFRGKDSPDFYALSLESDKGIIVDNIALRGSSGTFFHQVNNRQLKQFYDFLNVKCIILQFGGNSLPAVTSDSIARNYAGYIRYQLSVIKKIAPRASILFIGPSDMSVKAGTEYITHPYLESMRDALKKEVLESGGAFFDLFDCMGGRNSMPVWVDKNLAASDYTHFSPKGARKISTMLYAALINEYNNHLKSKH
jgi:lysophospholipase L1-like esterase